MKHNIFITVMQILLPDCRTSVFMMITLSGFTSYTCDHTGGMIKYKDVILPA